MNRPATQSTRWAYIPLAMCMSMVALALARLAYGVLLPFMQSDLSLTFQQAGNLGAASSLGYLALVLPVGYLTHRHGPRKVILGGLMLVIVGFIALTQVSQYRWLLLWMSVLGVSTALIYTPVVSFVVGWYPNRRGTVLGLVNSGIGAGIFLCGFVIPAIGTNAGSDGWRYVWALFAVVAGTTWIFAMWLLKDPPTVHQAVNQRLSSGVTVYRLRVVRVLGGCYFITGFSYIVLSVFMYSYALSSGLEEDNAGVMVSVAGVLSVFSGLMWGMLSDFIGRSLALTLCFTGVAVATLIPLFIPTESGFFAHYVISGLTLSGLFATIIAATTENTPGPQVPIAIGFVTTLFAIGQLLGPVAAGWLIEYSGSFRTAFGACAAVVLLGAILSFAVRPANS